MFTPLTETFQNALTETLNTHAFVASPEMVAAVAIAGRLDFNPLTDKLINQNGEEVSLIHQLAWNYLQKVLMLKTMVI